MTIDAVFLEWILDGEDARVAVLMEETIHGVNCYCNKMETLIQL